MIRLLPLAPFVLVFFLIACLVAYFLKSPEQQATSDAPLWPADPLNYNYNGHDYEVYTVPVFPDTKLFNLLYGGRDNPPSTQPLALI